MCAGILTLYSQLLLPVSPFTLSLMKLVSLIIENKFFICYILDPFCLYSSPVFPFLALNVFTLKRMYCNLCTFERTTIPELVLNIVKLKNWSLSKLD